jgi:hypothetical protein
MATGCVNGRAENSSVQAIAGAEAMASTKAELRATPQKLRHQVSEGAVHQVLSSSLTSAASVHVSARHVVSRV